MSDLTANANMKARGNIDEVMHPMTAFHAYEGALLMNNANGYAANAVATASTQFAGICLEEEDNTGGSVGDKKVKKAITGEFLLTFSDTLTQANVGDAVYATDSATATVTSATSAQVVGRITEFVSANLAWVKIDGAITNPALGT